MTWGKQRKMFGTMKSIIVIWFCLAVSGISCSPKFHENIDDGKQSLIPQKNHFTLMSNRTNVRLHDTKRQTVNKYLKHDRKNDSRYPQQKKDTVAIKQNETMIKRTTIQKQNSTLQNTMTNFTKEKNVKKADVFLIDSSKFGDDGSISPMQHQNEVGEIISPEDNSVVGDKKGNILPNNDADVSNIEGTNPDTFEQDLTIKTNEITGNVVPIESNNFKSLDAVALQSNIPAEIEFLKGEKTSKTNTHQDEAKPEEVVADSKSSIEQSLSPNEKVVDSILEPIQATNQYTPTNFMNTASAIKSDPAVSKAVNADNMIDGSIKEAINAQLQHDDELATGKAQIQNGKSEYEGIPESEIKSSKGDLKNTSFIGDIANVAEVVDKFASNRRPKGKYPKHNQKLKPHKLKFNRKQKSNAFSNSFDIDTRVSSLSQSEQNLIASIDHAARRKDTANEVATRLMMPVKTEAFSEQTIAPSEQLLDMLSHGKFREPLPESVLDKLASFDPNQAIGLQSFSSNKGREPGLMNIGSDTMPVRRINVKMPKTTQKPLINPKEMAKAEQLMKTNPYYLAQNNMLLDAKKYNSLQDLSNIGESIFPTNVIDLKQPMQFNSGNVGNSEEVAGLNAGNSGGSFFANMGRSEHRVSKINSYIGLNKVGGKPGTSGVGADNMQSSMPGIQSINTIEEPQITSGNVPVTSKHSACINDCQHGLRPMLSPINSVFQTHPVKVHHHEESHLVGNEIDPLVLKQINEMPTINMKKLLKMHRKSHHRPGTFKEVVSDTSIRQDSEDEYVPEQTVRLPEEHINHGYAVCKYGPCLNGGLCTAHPDKYYCSCLPGWIGSNCERRNNCFPNPCHYGTCSPNMDGFTCTCKVGFKGNLCNVLDRCHPNPCHSNGICTETTRGVQCECAPGFKGKLCEMESKCEPINPCLNGGVCREFFDHYHCSCSESFKGQNCEEYISPTRSPPTIPFKQVGPQVIPAPVNAPNTDIHDIYTYHSYDTFGMPFNEMHEEIRKGSDGLVNPGASLVPHPIIMKGMHSEPGNPFVGAPTLPSHAEVIVHQSDEKEDKTVLSSTSSDEESAKKLPESTKDDRYQTHVVQINKDDDGKSIKHPPYGHNYHVGDSMSMEYAPSNPSPNNDAEADKVLKENKHHREEAKESTHEHSHDEHITNEKHVPQNYFDHHNLELPENHHLIDDPHSTVVNEKASERSKLVKGPKEETGTVRSLPKGSRGKTSTPNTDDEDAKKNMKTIADLLKMFDKATKTLSNKIVRNANKFMALQGKPPFNPNSVMIGESTSRNEQPTTSSTTRSGPNFIPELKGDASTEQIARYIQNIYNLTNTINHNLVRSANVLRAAKKDELIRQEKYKNFTDHQKSAYKTWRRQALVNFHTRNPDKPIPKNTVSLSNNSLCPKFCRLFCDPWCVKIGCCKLPKDKLNIYKEIEKEHERQTENEKGNLSDSDNDIMTDATKMTPEKKTSVAIRNKTLKTLQNQTTGLHHPIHTCDKCSENADCINGLCKCKQGFNGDGEACTVDTCLLCHVDADCENKRCLCKIGYYGDGYQCNPIATKRHLCSRCHKMAECVSGNCICSTGFYGNGKNCWPIPII